MRRKLALAVLAASFLPAAYLGAQCTADRDLTKATATALVAARNAHWPLAVPHNRPIRTLEDFHGALLLAGPNVYQIESIRWQITPNRNLEVVSLDGYTPDGLHVQIDKSASPGRPIEAVADFSGFLFGRPKVDPKAFLVDAVDFSVDAAGFVAVSRFSGVDATTREAVFYSKPSRSTKELIDAAAPECGLRVTTSCDGTLCKGGACGAAPGCPCNGTSGGCSGTSSTVCSGTCPFPRVCNGSVANCACEPPPPPAGDDAQPR